ncbi:hypothetical protein BpHYR1_033721 [Brachionus plicatilis]|uniref:Uncharacterized protein n=1 Tax=Brachionus plicatilis TaxID=10195 RepID=A0A3M7QTE8_BRAPC|nr:hypothetical protein BpHYR1_033721 [Brachionus plicatilis]
MCLFSKFYSFLSFTKNVSIAKIYRTCFGPSYKNNYKNFFPCSCKMEVKKIKNDFVLSVVEFTLQNAPELLKCLSPKNVQKKESEY